jgi:siroheme synthase (precorrin-2 oxidase/ferrochelatase)
VLVIYKNLNLWLCLKKKSGHPLDLKNKRIVVVGLGRSGVATARFLVNQGARVTVTDRAPADTLKGLIRGPGRIACPAEAGRA